MVAMLRRVRTFFVPPDGRLRRGAIVAVVALAVTLGVLTGFTGIVQRLEWGIYDRVVAISAQNRATPEEIVLVALDEPSFQEVGLQWPWPRSIHAALIDSLRRAGAKLIVMDILFDTPADPFDDGILAEALAGPLPVVLAADIRYTASEGYLHTQTILPTEQFLDTGAIVGMATFPFDPDGTIRRGALTVSGYPTLAYAAYLAGDDVAGDGPPPGGGRSPLLRFYGAPRRGIRTVSYYQALAPEEFLPPGIVAGKTVFVGLSVGADADATSAVGDEYATPVGPRTPGVEIQATAYANLLDGATVADPFGAILPLILLSAGAAIALSVLFVRAPFPVALTVFLVFAIVLLFGGYALLNGGVRIPMVQPLVATGSVFVLVSVYRATLGVVERVFITGAFKHYLAPSVVDDILSDPSKLSLGGEVRTVTVLFSDLQGFTTISEQLPPEVLTELLRSYFRDMLAVLQYHDATLDKFIGDAIMAFFGAPLTTSDHAAQAVAAARGMQHAMEEVNRRNAERRLPALVTRIGINTGPVVAGNMGTEDVFNYTVMGDTVNLASRLEGVNKEYGTRTIASAATVAELPRAEPAAAAGLRLLDAIRVKGKHDAVDIYEVGSLLEGDDDGAFAALTARYGDALALYQHGDWSAAATAFAALVEDYGDGPSRTMLSRCRAYAEAPPADWDGVHVMTSK